MTQLSDGRSTFNTFPLLWCQNCGKADQPPARPSLPSFVDSGYLTCIDCGDKLALLQCVVRGGHFQERLGMPHEWVATLDSLPDRQGRWL